MKNYAGLFSLLFAMIGCTGEVAHEKFPGGAGRTSEVSQAQTTQAVLGGIDSLNNPLARGDGAARTGAKISGVATLAQGAQYKEGMSFFISARPIGGGPPLAVKRLGRVTFPYAFELNEENTMMEGTDFSGEVILSLRLDQDGNPLSQEAGDLSAKIKTTVGAEGLELILSP